MDVSEWQRRLENYFEVDGITGKPLVPVIEMESAHGRYVVQKFNGHFVLMDSFFGFFIETVNKAIAFARLKRWPSKYPNYPFVLNYYVTIFRSFRAAENLLRFGYPLDGFALLRDLKDRAIFLGALAHGKTSFPKLFGVLKNKPVTSITQKEYQKIKGEIKNEEIRILREMIRKESGLPVDVQKELKIWENFFHEEVHGSRLTFVQNIGWLLGKQPLSLGPVPNEKSIAPYVNRASEIGWLLLRTFPFLQLEPSVFGKEWREKRNVLDDSFHFTVEELAKLGKRIGEAIIVLAKEKFSFPSDLHYRE